jgi:hypothetical protein
MIEISFARKQIGVYGTRTPSRCQPEYFVNQDEARQRVNNGEARFINNKKSIRLLAAPSAQYERQFHKLRDLSASPGGSKAFPGGITERHVLGLGSYRDGHGPSNDAATLAEWKPKFRVIAGAA